MHSSLLVDYYELSMIEVYLRKGFHGPASFEFFVRSLPDNRNFLLAAGLEQVLDYVTGLCFSDEDLEYLKGLGFSPVLLDFLNDFMFSGDIWALPEGTIFFANEPILRVEAPLPQAQLLETRLINILHLQTLIASKAVRVKLSARGRSLVDFGFRRSHETDAGLLAARACYVAGFDATATVEAGRAFGVPVTGTMAHSYVLSHESEEQAFRNFVDVHGDKSILLIDSFDTIKGARLAARLYQEYKRRGVRFRGVRIDSGDLLVFSRRVKNIFERSGCPELAIFVSGGLDEFEIDRLLRHGAPIDGFGIGTIVDTSADAPYLDCAYKMVEYSGRGLMKFSIGKATLPFRKQVFRSLGKDGGFEGDILCTADENRGARRPLLEKVVESGRILKRPRLEDIRTRVARGIGKMPEEFLDIHNKADYEPIISERLRRCLPEEPG